MLMVLALWLACFPDAAIAGTKWGLSLDFSSISTSVSDGGVDSKFSGTVLPELRPEIQWDLAEGQEQLKVWLQATRFQFDEGTKTLVNNGQFFFGGGVSWGRYFTPGSLSIGLVFAQRPVWVSEGVNAWNLSKNILVGLPVEARTKLVVLEGEWIGAGVKITPLLLGINRSGSGYSAGAFLEYETRALREVGVRLFYEIREMTFSNLGQSDVVIGISGRLSFNDVLSDSVPMDERE
jgi:hypothetical protein